MLTGKNALVTGAGRGIGKAIALELAAKGAFVIVNYNGSKDAAEQTVAEIKAAGGDAVAYQCSVSDYEACGAMITALIKEYAHIDILVNNAGITRDGLLMKMSEEDFDAVINTNLKGCFNTIRHMSRYFLKQRAGKIINISSVSGILGNAGQANYSASKAGVIGLTKAVARELASRGINVNAVAPGFVETDMTDALSDSVKENLKSQIPLGKIGHPQDIAKAVSEYAVLMDDQEYSVFVFELYAGYIEVSAKVLALRVDEKRTESIHALSEELRKKSVLLRDEKITETAYIEECLWISLEAMIKLLSAYAGSLAGQEYIDFLQAVSMYAFEYGRLVLYKKEQDILTEYLEKQYQLDVELSEKFESFKTELKRDSDRFNELVALAFDPGFRETLKSSVELAKAAGVDQEEILDSVEKIDSFFMD